MTKWKSVRLRNDGPAVRREWARTRDAADDKGKMGGGSKEEGAGHASGRGAVTSPHVRCLAVVAASNAAASSLTQHPPPAEMGLLYIFWLTAILAASLGISLLITVPLTGALVRVRGMYAYRRISHASLNHALAANYNPRGLQLDADGNIEPHTGPVVTSFVGMLARVKRIEVSLSKSRR